MSLFEDMFKGNVGTGLAVGIGVAVVGPLLTPIIGGVLRPVSKAIIKGGLLAYDAGREGMAQLNEMSGDIVAEARSELNEARAVPEQPARGRGKSASAEATSS